MTTISELREALESVPRVLLDENDRRVMAETLVSLDALEQFDVVPTVLAFVGSSGSGKSALVNAVLGADISSSGPVRPATELITMIGSSGPVSLAAESEYLHLPSVRPGLLVIDTPPWEHDPAGVRAAVAASDLVVVVVTPSRYADASIAELVAAIPSGQPSAVVLNRIDVSDDDRVPLLESVRARFGSSVVCIDEGDDMDEAVEALIGLLRIDSVEYQRAAVLRSAASAGADYIARRVAETVDRLAQLERALDRASAPSLEVATLPILERWNDTRAAVVERCFGAMSSIDASMVADGGPLAENLQELLPAVDPDPIASSLDSWRAAVSESFIGAARIRWRRNSAIDQIRRFSWRVGMNSAVQTPPRFRRVMGGRLASCAAKAHEGLDALLNEHLEARLSSWREAGADIGVYAPGVLLALSESFVPEDPRRG